MRDWVWTGGEKAIARKAFDLAVERELAETIREAQGRAAAIRNKAELWSLGEWIDKRRKEIDSRYDFRYSMLPLLFSNLISDERITFNDLQGLAREKLDVIRKLAEIRSRE